MFLKLRSHAHNKIILREEPTASTVVLLKLNITVMTYQCKANTSLTPPKVRRKSSRGPLEVLKSFSWPRLNIAEICKDQVNRACRPLADLGQRVARKMCKRVFFGDLLAGYRQLKSHADYMRALQDKWCFWSHTDHTKKCKYPFRSMVCLRADGRTFSWGCRLGGQWLGTIAAYFIMQSNGSGFNQLKVHI